jgi:hypothetical protein
MDWKTDVPEEAQDRNPSDEVPSPEALRPVCPNCGWSNTRLSHTQNALDIALSILKFEAYRCRACGNRFRVRRRRE